MVVGSAFNLTTIGILVGILATFGARRLISGFLFEVSAADPLTLVTICVLLIVVALLASFVPARRAVRVDPTTILRQE
jgi:putative ABC transport system permease protein